MTPEPNYDEVRAPRRRRWYLLIAAFFGCLALTLWLAEDEIRELAWDLREERWQAKCEATRQREVCGRWAMRQIFVHDDFESMKSGLSELDELCARDQVHLACEYAARLRSDRNLEWMFGREHSFFERRAKRAREACRADEPHACLVDAWLHAEPGEKAPPKQGAASEGSCFDGQFAKCAASDDGEERALAPLAKAEVGNPALYGVKVARPDEARSCDEGSALSCFADGLNGTADVNPFAGDPIPVRSLEVTMGRACELNHGHSCYVFALRLLDQRSPSREHQKHASRLLEMGCELGHQRSCWLEAMRTDPLADLDVFRELVQTACEHAPTHGPTCVLRNHVFAYELGVEPFLVADNDAYRRMRWGCWVAGDDESCIAGASLMLESGRAWMPAVPPLLVQGAQLAETACRGGNPRGCRLLFEYAAFQHTYGMATEKALRKKICAQLPNACE